MEIGEDRSDLEKEGEEEEEDSVFDLLRDRFRLSAISIAEAEGPFYPQILSFFFILEKGKVRYLKLSHFISFLLNYECKFLILTKLNSNLHLIRAAKRNGMEILEPIVACIADLAFKYTGKTCRLSLFTI